MNSKVVENIIGQLRDIQSGITWYDDNFEKKIASLPEEKVFERPIPEIHSVAELISHIWVWRMDTIKKFKGLQSNLTIESPENWKSNEELRIIGWEKLKSDLTKSQIELTNLLADKTDDYLENNQYEGKYSLKYMVEGIIHHDLYHLGQIGITIKLLDIKK